MKKLEEDFEKVSKAIRDKSNIAIAIAVFEQTYKDDKVLKEYKSLLKKLEQAEKEISNAKTYMYEDMLEEDQKKISNDVCSITLKRPYEKTVFNLDLFLQDYKPQSKQYKRYVSKSTVKGNITIKVLEEEK